MMNLIVPIMGAVALVFIVAGAICLLTDAEAESDTQRNRDRDEPGARRAHRADRPSSTT